MAGCESVGTSYVRRKRPSRKARICACACTSCCYFLRTALFSTPVGLQLANCRPARFPFKQLFCLSCELDLAVWRPARDSNFRCSCFVRQNWRILFHVIPILIYHVTSVNLRVVCRTGFVFFSSDISSLFVGDCHQEILITNLIVSEIRVS